MITWIILGYLAVSLVTSLLLYGAYVVAARADQLEQSTETPYLVLDYPVSKEQQTLVTSQQLVLNA